MKQEKKMPIWAQAWSVFVNAHNDGYKKIWIEDGKDKQGHFVDIFCENEKEEQLHYGFGTSEAKHHQVNNLVRHTLNRFIVMMNESKTYKLFRVSSSKTIDDPPYVKAKNTKDALVRYARIEEVKRTNAKNGKWCVQQVEKNGKDWKNVGKKVWYEEK